MLIVFVQIVLNKLRWLTTNPSHCFKQFFPTQCFHVPLHHWSVCWYCKLITQIFNRCMAVGCAC